MPQPREPVVTQTTPAIRYRTHIMADDNTPDDSSTFDDWLDEQPGPPTDPVELHGELASDDAEEIAEWMAFTGGTEPVAAEAPSTPGSGQAQATDPDPEALPPVGDALEETGEMDVRRASSEADVSNPAAADLFSRGDAEAELADTVEVVDTDEGTVQTSEDTGDLEIVSFAPVEEPEEDLQPLPPESRELFDLSSSEYVATATTEHSDLAEAIAAASTLDTEQVPITAPIPGMADSVVGFEDVVEAEGIGRVRSRASGDLVARIITGVVLVAALLGSLVWRPVLAVFVVAVFVVGASEFYTSLVRTGHKPVSVFGFIGIIGAAGGAYFWGPLSIPTAFIIAVALLLLYYAVVPGKRDPLGNLALTITVMVWVGLGVYAMMIIRSDSYRPLVIGVVVTVVAMDIGQYFIGRSIGRTPLAPWVSPKKTVEGLAAGVVIAMAIGALLHFVDPFELTSGLALGAVVAVLSPLGDLAMSAAKRCLGLKDMGSVLPGHGGFLDRIDGLLFVIPAAWVVFMWAGIL